ncbi:sensor histidine kinase [Streptomonospora sp. S1-112]|uniref:histidine kinase n=1 Tax=Streptomonospora mangrovi TaxID=2883123 RepID=A0A9X3SN38_9ACTN|nr:sensor histidine kinase [Streptomonospora mangrovi]MDA0564791.1 sensor histidine kinase [Streptomonospora mangrovi]
MSAGTRFDVWPPRGPVRDAVIAAGTAVLVVLNALLAAAPAGGLAAPAYPLLLAGPALLAVRTRAPRAVLVAVLVWVAAVGALLGTLGPLTVLPALVMVFTAVRAGHRSFTAWTVGVFLAVAVGATLAQGGADSAELQEQVLAVGWFAAAGVLGEVFRQYAAYLAEAERAAAEARRTREEAALRRAGEERLRIARELHDSLTHAISIIKVQAGVAVHLARKRGEEVPEALLAIQEASGEATRELRATLEVLRRPGDEAPVGPASARGLADLAALAESTRRAGLPVSVEIEGERRALPEEVERAAYRIVQEAVTNAARHAGEGASAVVRIGYGPGVLTVRVEDDGGADPAAPPVPGTGLLGIRERVAALGGTVRAEPRAKGGFRVAAELPAPERTGGEASAAPAGPTAPGSPATEEAPR